MPSIGLAHFVFQPAASMYDLAQTANQGEGAMPRVTGLGHVGFYVRDLERMVGFYRDVMGMQVTKQNWRLGIVFLSADPEAVDHEIALMRGRPSAEDPHLIQQISMRAASLDDLRAFLRRLRAEGYRIENVVNHASAIGCYFFDPEGNRTEVFWVTGRPSWVPVANPIDIEQPDEVVLAEVDRLWEQVRHVPVGGTMVDEPEALQIGPQPSP
jgi:catechol 2,3-dioxygenase